MMIPSGIVDATKSCDENVISSLTQALFAFHSAILIIDGSRSLAYTVYLPLGYILLLAVSCTLWRRSES